MSRRTATTSAPPRRPSHPHVALLRAVNVGGRTNVSMTDVRRIFADAGAREVTTYAQSGNVVFDADDAAAVTRAAERALTELLGGEATIVLRSGAELARVVRDNPFAADASEPKQLHVAFLAEPPDPALVEAIDPDRGGADRFHAAGREVYLYFPNGYGRTKIPAGYFERALRVPATARNWRTVTKLAELAGGP